MSSSDALLLAMIHECIRTGRYAFTAHAMTKHTTVEGFTQRQAIEAINNGIIIEHRSGDCRCVVAGTASGLVVSRDYITTYIHCVCQYDDINRMVIVTMYRPKSADWASWNRRR